MKIAATGGPPVALCALGPGVGARGATWNRDGIIVFNNGPATLYRVSQGGGTATPMGAPTEGEIGRQFPWFLPDGHHVLYHSVGSQDLSGVYVTSIDTPGESQPVLSSDTGAIYDSRSRHLLFGRQGTLMAQAFDPKTFALSGDAFPIAERGAFAAVPGGVAFSVSETGALVHVIRAPVTDVAAELVWVDRQGKRTGTAGPPGNYRGLDLSPDGSQVAAHRHDADGGDVWLTNVSRGTTSRFTFDAAQDNASPAWSPDGSRIAFSSIRSGKAGVYVKNANNSGDEVRLFETEVFTGGTLPQPQSWTADGRSVLFQIFSGKTTWHDLWLLPTSGDRKAAALLNGPDIEGHGQFSPDGKWLAYKSGNSTSEIFVQSATATGGKWAVSTGGGGVPRWRGDSRELFYMAGAKMMAVGVTSKGDAFEQGTPTPLFDHGILGAAHADYADYFPYAVTKDGQRFLISRPVSAAAPAPAPSPIVVVLNWIEGIKK